MDETLLCRHAREIFDAALRECGVQQAFKRKLTVSSEGGRTLLGCGSDNVDLSGVRHIRIVAAGKAGAEVLSGFLSLLPPEAGFDIQGVLICPEVSRTYLADSFLASIQFFAGGHPLPNRASFDGAAAALAMIREASSLEHCVCVFLISGGASAMMELPLDPAISLADTAVFYQRLVHSGATISEINCVRKHFSAVKGGRLAQAAGDASCLTLLVSDVPPQHLDALASGPTLPDSSTVEQCLSLLTKYSLRGSLPESVRRYFDSSAIAETPKAMSQHSKAWVLLDSNDLGMAAAIFARSLGYRVVVDNACNDWSFSDAATYLLDRIRSLRAHGDRICLISAGEVTVSVSNDAGALARTAIGGRNQHFALHTATQLRPSDAPLCVLSAGSDGIDGNSIATGAVVSSETLRGASGLQQAEAALKAFDSFTFLHGRNATIITGPTGNNLRDLRILLAGGRSGE